MSIFSVGFEKVIGLEKQTMSEHKAAGYNAPGLEWRALIGQQFQA